MTEDSEEARLRERFQQLRKTDEERTPSFAAVRNRAFDQMGRAGHSPVISRPAFAAALLALITGFSWILFQLSRNPAEPQPAIQLSGWQSPTGFLLRSPNWQSLNAVPRLGESLTEIKTEIRDEKK